MLNSPPLPPRRAKEEALQFFEATPDDALYESDSEFEFDSELEVAMEIDTAFVAQCPPSYVPIEPNLAVVAIVVEWGQSVLVQ